MVFPGSFKDVSIKFQGCIKRVSRVFQGSFEGVSRNFQGCFKEVTGVFQGSFKGDLSRMCQESLKDVSRKFKVSRVF